MSSQPRDFNASNLYATPQAGAFGPPPSETRRFPVFAKVMFIIDLVFSILRAPAVLLSVIGYQQLVKEQSPLVAAVAAEIVSGAILVLLGVTTNFLLLLRKAWAVALGYLLLLATCGSLAVGVWETVLAWEDFAPGSPERIGGVIGGGFALSFRLGLMAVYFAALRQFATWAKSRAESEVFPADYLE